MPNFDIIKKTEPIESFRVKAIMGQYDLQETNIAEKFTGSIDLPDYQGVGIGTAFTDTIAQMFYDDGKSYISTTSNPAMIFARSQSKKWRTTRIGRTGIGSGKIQNRHKKGSTSSNRITVSFEYKGCE